MYCITCLKAGQSGQMRSAESGLVGGSKQVCSAGTTLNNRIAYQVSMKFHKPWQPLPAAAYAHFLPFEQKTPNVEFIWGITVAQHVV